MRILALANSIFCMLFFFGLCVVMLFNPDAWTTLHSLAMFGSCVVGAGMVVAVMHDDTL